MTSLLTTYLLTAMFVFADGSTIPRQKFKEYSTKQDCLVQAQFIYQDFNVNSTKGDYIFLNCREIKTKLFHTSYQIK